MLLPGFHRNAYVVLAAVVVAHFEGIGQHQPIKVGERYVRTVTPVALAGHHLLHSHVELPVVRVPTAPEPSQILAGFAFHEAEEIGRTGVLIGPGLDVAAKYRVETFRPDDLFAQ